MTYGDKMRAEGWTNTCDQHPEKPGMYLVEDHNHDRFTAEFDINKFMMPVWKGTKGYDICWWKRKEHKLNDGVAHKKQIVRNDRC